MTQFGMIMFKRLAAVALATLIVLPVATSAQAAGAYPKLKPKELDWSFAGPFGKWDQGSLQRGLKVYTEVCSACHALNLVRFRELEGLGLSDEQVRSFAASYQVTDGPNADGEMFERPGLPTDRFPSPYPNKQAAIAANNGAYPPDQSLITKARAVERGFPTFIVDIFTMYAESGPDYVYSLLTGYGKEPPAGETILEGLHYNPYFIAGPALAMAAPLSDGIVSYPDGAPETVSQYSRDVTTFLAFAAEPSMIERKQRGFVVLLFLIILAGLLYYVKKKVFADVAEPNEWNPK